MDFVTQRTLDVQIEIGRPGPGQLNNETGGDKRGTLAHRGAATEHHTYRAGEELARCAVTHHHETSL